MNEEKHDPLVKFISTHKEDFDELKAPRHVWEELDSKLFPKQRVHPGWKWTAIAASVLLCIGVGYTIGYRQSDHQIAGWKEYEEAESYYQMRISNKLNDMRNAGVEENVLHDLEMLDTVYLDLRDRLEKDPNTNSKQVLSKMILHQQQKLKAMELILDKVEKYKPDQHEILEM